MKAKHLLAAVSAFSIMSAGPVYAKAEKKSGVETNKVTESVFRCNMNALTAAQSAYYQTLAQMLRETVQEIREQPDGFSLRLPADSATVRKAAEFITLERLCCPFLSFQLAVAKENEPLWITLTGPEGVKDFLRLEFGLGPADPEAKPEQNKK
jgi:hypothetical protein